MGFIKEFKEFAMKGNVMDMAVGVIIGGAFGKIVSSLVNDVLDEVTILQHGSHVALAKGELQLGEIHVAGNDANERHQDVVNQTRYNFTESTADDNTDSHVHHVALHGKLLKFFYETHNSIKIKKLIYNVI